MPVPTVQEFIYKEVIQWWLIELAEKQPGQVLELWTADRSTLVDAQLYLYKYLWIR